MNKKDVIDLEVTMKLFRCTTLIFNSNIEIESPYTIDDIYKKARDKFFFGEVVKVKIIGGVLR